jgi:cyclase
VSKYALFALDFSRGAVAQLGEHLVCNQGVVGSNPIRSIGWSDGDLRCVGPFCFLDQSHVLSRKIRETHRHMKSVVMKRLTIPSVLMAALLSALPWAAHAQVRVTSLAEHVILLQTPRGNLVASVGSEGAVLVGAVDTISAAAIADTLRERAGSPRRFVIGIAGLASVGQADGGWDRMGALVTMQELAVRRMSKTTTPGLRRPRGEFSQFFSLEFNDESIHAVQQEPGYATSDVLVHFHTSNVVYLGESFPGDGYPRIDSALGGTVEGLLKTLEPWTRTPNVRFVGARGALARDADIRAFREMVTAVRDRVRRMKRAGRSLAQVIAARPTAQYDQRWGRGVVTAENFVSDVYRAVR